MLDPKISATNRLDWQAICQQILAEKEQRRLTSNQLTFSDHEIDDVYVPLGLVEYQKVTQQRENVAANEGLYFYREKETTQGFEHSEFLEQVLRQENSPNSKGKRLRIIGEPGAGKTTLLRQIANWVAAEIPGAIVIWVSLADLLGKELEPYLFDKWLLAALNKINKGEVTAEIKDDFVAQFNAERVWLVLDGADEMAVGNSNPLAEIQRQIRTDGCIHKARIVLSCRQNVWAAIDTWFDIFDTYQIREFSYPEQVENFIDKWYEKIDPQRGKQLREALAASGQERIRDLVKNPVRCSLLCGTWQSLEGDLPDTKAKLYQRFVTTLYQWKEPRLNWIQQQELNVILGKLALSGMLNETSRFLLPESVGYREMGKSSFELACRLGWLNLVGRTQTGEGIYSFYHPTFQEYFAALVIDDWHFFLNHLVDNPQHSDARYRIFENQWKEVILLWLGREEVGKKEKEAFIEALVKFKVAWDKFYGYRAYFLAAAGIAEFKECRRGDEIVRQIVTWGFGYFNKQKQDWRTFLYPIAEIAREVVKETDRKRAISALVELIGNSGDEYTRRQATKSLGQIGKDCPDTIATLVELINTSHNEVTRWQAADILGKIDKDSPVAIASLAELIHTSVDKNTWKRAAYSLGKIGKDSPVAIAALVELIHNSVENDVAWFGWYAVPTYIIVADSLVKIGKNNPVAIAALVELIRTSDNKVTQGRSAEILGKIDKDNSVAIETLLNLIRNYRPKDTRYQAAERLATIAKNNPVAIAALVDLIRTSGNKVTRWRAAECLGKIDKGNTVAILALVDLIRNSGNKVTRWRAVESLDKIGENNPIAIAALIELIRNSGDEYTRRIAAEGLGKMVKDHPEAISALVELIHNSGNEYTWKIAAESLGKIGKDHPEVISALIELIRNSCDEYTRRIAAESLGEIGKNNSVALSALIELIGTSQNEDTRWRAAESLRKTDKNHPVAISTLVELIGTSQDYHNRGRAVDSLGEIGKDNPVALSALVELIRNSHEYTRRITAYSLGKIRKYSPETISALVELIHNSRDGDTRCVAAYSLGKIDKDSSVAIAGLVELIRNSRNEDTVYEPADYLGEIMTGKHFATAVSGLKKCLTSEIYKNNLGRNETCYKVIWYCAQNMTYPDFYQAWHTQPEKSST